MGAQIERRKVKKKLNETMNIMRIKTTIGLLLVAGILTVVGSGCATHKSQAELQAKAKISQAEAQQTALAKVPGGTVKESELEMEHGKLVWSFDIATPGTKDITEILVDAVTGQIAGVEHETPDQQAQEAIQKQREKK